MGDRPKTSEHLQRAAAPYPVAPAYRVPYHMTSTSFTIDGYQIVRVLGVVCGITVRSRSLVGNIGATFQRLVGGNITLYTNLCEKTREEAFDIMLEHAGEIGANAVVGVRYDATEIAAGTTEVLAYGTAVLVESLARETYTGPGSS